MARRDTAEVLAKARRIYETARLGLDDLLGDDPRRRVPGFWNAVTFGRNVTFVLQNLRTIDADGFDAWYRTHQEFMRGDPLLQYFNKLRNVIEKEGGPTTTSRVVIDHLDSLGLQEAMKRPPPAALSFFIGDSIGGSGWMVEMPGGEREPFYVELPYAIRVKWAIDLPDPPAEHLGEPVADGSAQHLCTLFLAYVGSLLAEAEAYFGVGRQRPVDG